MKQLRQYIRQMLKEKLSREELETAGHPTSLREYEKSLGLSWNSSRPKKLQAFEEWVQLAYADDSEIKDALLYEPKETLEKYMENPENEDRIDRQDYMTAIWWKKLEKDELDYNYIQNPEFSENFDFPESELPSTWKENLKKHNWVRGKGFQHKYLTFNGKPAFLNPYELRGVEDIGLAKNPFETQQSADPKILQMSKEKRETGRKDKQDFAKVYNQNRDFFDNLYYVHWQSDLDKLSKFTSNPTSRDEISVTWFLDTPLKAGNETYGVLIHGRPTYVGNVNLYSGYHSGGGIGTMESEDKDQFLPAYWKDMPHRTKSSGVNKYPKAGIDMVKGPTDVDSIQQDKFRQAGFKKTEDGDSFNNEAIIDNWEPVAILIPEGKDAPNFEKVQQIATENNLPIFDQNHDVI